MVYNFIATIASFIKKFIFFLSSQLWAWWETLSLKLTLFFTASQSMLELLQGTSALAILRRGCYKTWVQTWVLLDGLMASWHSLQLVELEFMLRRWFGWITVSNKTDRYLAPSDEVSFHSFSFKLKHKICPNFI